MLLFFEPIEEAMRAEVLEIMKTKDSPLTPMPTPSPIVETSPTLTRPFPYPGFDAAVQPDEDEEETIHDFKRRLSSARRSNTLNKGVQDMQLKGEKRTSSTSLGDLERTTSLLSLCLSLQGIPVDGLGPVANVQQRNASLALQCVNRAPSPHCEKSQWFLRT